MERERGGSLKLARANHLANGQDATAELPPHRLMMLCRCFQDYKMLAAKPVEVDEIEPAARALLIIEDSLQRYSENRRRGFP